MAKTKADWLKEAKELKLDVTEKNTVAEITEAIKKASSQQNAKSAKGVGNSAVEQASTAGASGVAKAGKRSAKALKETEEKQAKEERKVAKSEEEIKPKEKPVKPVRSRLERRGKKYRKNAESIDKNKEYSLKDALELAIKTSTTKFDASVELHIRLNVDPKQADQNVRDSIILPEGTGKTLEVAVLAEDELAKKAKSAGASITGTDEIFKLLDKNQINFDVLIAVPELMAKLSKYARILGPKGLMPNPKSGTVTKNVEKAVKESLAGKVEYRVDSTGIVHLAIGKASFGTDKLNKNAESIIDSIKTKKPSSIKGVYVKSIYVASTMGPSIKVNSGGTL